MKKLALYAAGAAALVLLGAAISAWYFPPKERTLYRAVQVPYIAERTPLLDKVKTEERCVPTVVYRPTERQEERLGVSAPRDSDLLTAGEVKPLPYGGKAVVTIPRPTVEIPFPEAEITVVPNKQPFVEWMGVRDATLLAGVDQDLERVVSLRLGMDLVRTGPAIWRVEMGSFGTTHDQRFYAMGGVKVRF